jgi:nucleotide-binding universal stress UspA family protein
VEEKNPSLIIMGITGAGKAAQVLIGSNTTSVMKKIHTPLLIIPKQAKYKKVEKILLACDYNSEMDEDVLEKIKRYVQLFKAKLYVIDVITHEAVPAYENTIAEFKLEHSLREIPHTTFFPHSENISDEINSFADYYKYDWLVMMPHKHKFPDSLFHKSNTKQMAFHTHIPLLTIHD